jgi:hypothetical protein
LPHQPHQLITVERDALPPGHDYLIVVRHDIGDVLVFVAADDRAQAEAREAFLSWERLRDGVPAGRPQR